MALRQYGCKNPPASKIFITTLSGAARSLTSFQNQQLFMIDVTLDHGDFTYIDDVELIINQTVTTMKGGIKGVKQEFKKLCAEDPPFARDGVLPYYNVIRLLN